MCVVCGVYFVVFVVVIVVVCTGGAAVAAAAAVAVAALSPHPFKIVYIETVCDKYGFSLCEVCTVRARANTSRLKFSIERVSSAVRPFFQCFCE